MTHIFDLETTGLSPLERQDQLKTNRILCISLLSTQPGAKPQTFCGADERAILDNFFKALEQVQSLVGFNTDFDLEFIYVRSILLGVRIPDKLQRMIKYDIRQIINPFNRRAVGTLGDYATLLGKPPRTSNGAEVPELAAQGNWSEIQAHCEEDVELTLMLYNRAKACNRIS